MYPSGAWEGFWQQEYYGRQSMREFTLTFADGRISGGGGDIVGRFTFAGTYDTASGRVRMVKQYLGKHAVFYEGHPDGEGCIAGTWTIADTLTGSFLLRPVIRRPRGDEPIQEIG